LEVVVFGNFVLFVSLLLVVMGMALYLWPVPRVPFNTLYAKVDGKRSGSLLAFRSTHPAQSLVKSGARWDYVSFGQDKDTIVFLHGMTGAYDIWWNQLDALSPSCRVISVTYPAVDTLGKLAAGVLAILDAEKVEKATFVGSSLGGYLAQYIVARHPDRVSRAAFANTFPPNDLIAAKNKSLGKALPFLPEWLVIKTLRDSFARSVYPASGFDELTLAFLNEIGCGRMRKAQVIGRFNCVVEKFVPPDLAASGIPVMIIEADNDPLVEPSLREQLKQTYPAAIVHTLAGAGHFPYLNRVEEYTRLLKEFLTTETATRPSQPKG